MLDYNDAKTCLMNFFCAMNKWELSNAKPLREGGEAEQESAQREINYIFERFCTPKKRKNGRQTTLHCGIPPEYDVDNQKLISYEGEKDKCIIYTEQLNRLKNKYRYTLVYKKNQWMIDKKEWLEDEKWQSDYL